MTTSLLIDTKNDIYPARNIALSPIGYWPRTNWRRFCRFMRFSMRMSLLAGALLFFSMTGCSDNQSSTQIKGHTLKAASLVSKLYHVAPSYTFARAALGVVVCSLEQFAY